MKVWTRSASAGVAAGLLALVMALWPSTGLSADQDGDAFFTDVRRAYTERSSYADIGEIEITDEVDGIEATRLHFFETSATRGAGLVWRVMMASDRGFEDRAVWLTGDSVMIYDGGLRQAKPAPSMAAALEGVLGSVAGQAVLIPTLLEFGAGSATLDALAFFASSAPPEPCFEDKQCRIVSAPLPGGGTVRLTVETETYWIHDVEVVAPGKGKTTTIRISHSANPFDDQEAQKAPESETTQTRSTFSPPPSTRTVDDWEIEEEATVDSPAALEGFFDVLTIDLVTVTARIVDDTGARLPDLEPNDLIATIGDQEVPVTAVDWFAATAEPLRPSATPTPEIDSVAEREGRILVIFLQNDFEPTRVKGHMKLFPGLRKIVDNLGPADRVAVLSFYAHLKLWRDFTTDKKAVKASLESAFFPGAIPGPVQPGRTISLLDVFDEQEAREIPTSGAAMRYIAEALAHLPGEKEIIFFGYGLEGPRLPSTLRALQSARATTFIVDTTQADSHTLGTTLDTMARATGGTYNSSFFFADRALHRIERMLAGYYTVALDRSNMPEVNGRLRLRLRDRKGMIFMKPTVLH